MSLGDAPARFTIMRSFSRQSVVCLALGTVLTLFRLILAGALPVAAVPYEVVDSWLFSTQALSILQGDWLGVYDNTTLVKNAGYSLILAFCGWSGIPYQIVLTGSLVVSALLFTLALRPLCKSPWVSLCIYCFILFTPLLFTKTFFRRVYRDGAVIAPAVALLASYVALYLRRKQPFSHLVPWALAGGVSFGLLLIIKENATWAVPLIVVSSLVMVAGWVVQRVRRGCTTVQFASRVGLIAVPLVVALLFPTSLCFVNQLYYGVDVTNERSQGGFSQACAELAIVDTGDDPSALWISRSALSLALEQSETLQSIEDELWSEWDIWALNFSGDEVYGDMAFWALRDAYRDGGGYTDAVEVDAFWTQVADELACARENGAYAVRQGLKVSSTSPPIPPSQIASWLVLSAGNCASLLTYNRMEEQLVENVWQADERAEACAEAELQVRAILGGNTLLFSADDSTLERTSTATTLARILGKCGIWLDRIMLVLAAIAAVFLIVQRKGFGTKRLFDVALIVVGLCMSAFVFEAATSWYVSYQLTTFDLASFHFESFKYSPEFYVMIMLAECTLLAAAVDFWLNRKASRTMGAADAAIQPSSRRSSCGF